ncbi:uncharacterized protein LOC6542828 [Drosophila erecta]|uniref:C-type lectin domain-containing protein n=1 Tax=Drosophila erecta TaxID=7220 RepID=B3N6W1_DROER|nr:uncharacterized protein LOC6542828 [Drosophila erecta]EDV58210.1 uncharacterized protein Dere_GG24106 [Drosophila erecta]
MSQVPRILCCLPILLLLLRTDEANGKGICLYVSEKTATWFHALAICKKLHMCLANLDTEITLIQMKSKIGPDEHEYWFGLNAYEKPNFRYVSNNKSIEYAPHNSKLVNNEGCVFVKEQYDFFKFESANCDDRRRFICTKTEECDGVTFKHEQSKCVITEEQRDIVAY